MYFNIKTIIDIIYPRFCIICGSKHPAASKYLCWECIAKHIQFIQPPFCSICGAPTSGIITNDYTCSCCSVFHPAFSKARGAALFNGYLREIIHAFKYQKKTYLLDDLAKLLLASLKTNFDISAIDIITYVPMHISKQKERGFNQAELLAQKLGELTKKSVLRNGLMRTIITSSQTSLSIEKRKENVKNVFKVCWPNVINNKRILLIDDVMTTGATFNECALVLKQAGATVVNALSVARG